MVRTEQTHTKPERVRDRTRPDRIKPNRTEPNRTEPNRTEPNRTEPNRTEPNRTDPNRAAAEPNLGQHTKKNTSKSSRTVMVIPNRTKPKMATKHNLNHLLRRLPCPMNLRSARRRQTWEENNVRTKEKSKFWYVLTLQSPPRMRGRLHQ